MRSIVEAAPRTAKPAPAVSASGSETAVSVPPIPEPKGMAAKVY